MDFVHTSSERRPSSSYIKVSCFNTPQFINLSYLGVRICLVRTKRYMLLCLGRIVIYIVFICFICSFYHMMAYIYIMALCFNTPQCITSSSPGILSCLFLTDCHVFLWVESEIPSPIPVSEEEKARPREGLKTNSWFLSERKSSLAGEIFNPL